MKKFEVVRKTVEISYKNRERIKEGCTIYSEPDVLESFDTMEDAMQELAKHHTSIRELKKGVLYCVVEEYMIVSSEYDEAGGWIAGGDVLAISPMNNQDSF